MMYLPKIFILLLSSHLVLALVTLDTIRDLTSLTDECRDRITDEGDVIQLPGTEQVHLGSGQEDGGEIEDVSRMSNPFVLSRYLSRYECAERYNGWTI